MISLFVRVEGLVVHSPHFGADEEWRGDHGPGTEVWAILAGRDTLANELVAATVWSDDQHVVVVAVAWAGIFLRGSRGRSS
jgi:hypothetical protein